MTRGFSHSLCLLSHVVLAASAARAGASQAGVSPQALAKWEARLAKRTEIEVKSGGRPTVRLSAMRRTARVVAVSGGTLTLSAGGATVSREVSRMTPEEKASLAESLAGGAGGEQEAAMAAFFLFAAGDGAEDTGGLAAFPWRPDLPADACGGDLCGSRVEDSAE
jgi:hypothetical protein